MVVTMYGPYGRFRCVDCEGVARGALPKLMDTVRCRQCREEDRD